VVVVDALEFDAPKTARLRDLLGAIETGEKAKVLVLTDGVKPNVYLSSRNLPNVKVLPFGDESAYDILWARTLVIERGAIDRVGGTADAEETEE
jgi:large subunit ribosomal protein L4